MCGEHETVGNLIRIATYVNWPTDTSISCLLLARSGFVYTGVSDQVTCRLCGLVVSDWRQKSINPLNEHRQRSPHCPFFTESSSSADAEQLSGRVVGSLSSSLRQDLSSTEQSATSDISAVYRSALSRAERHGVTGNTPISRDSAGIDRANPDYGLLRDEGARLSTFSDWPASGTVQPLALAHAGFFYTGQTDRTCCAFCRRVLHRWQPGDDPDVEHRRSFPECPFVRQQDVGNIPLRRDASPDQQTAALGLSDVTYSTSGIASSLTAPSAATISSAAADVSSNNPTEYVNPGQVLAAGSSELQTLTGGNSEEQQRTQMTANITNTIGKCQFVR